MKKNKNFEEFKTLKKDWWWRRLKFAKFIEPTPANRYPNNKYSTQSRKGLSENKMFQYYQWKDGLERICYSYELYRRTAKISATIRPLLMPFNRLNDKSLEFMIKSKISTYFIMQGHHRCLLDDSAINQMSDAIPAGRFWLRERKSKLLTQFWEEIEKQRRIRNLVETLPKNAGNSNRSVSWQAVELLDEKCYRSLRGSEIECIRLSKRHSAELFPIIESAFSEYIRFCKANGPMKPNPPLICEWIRKI